MAWEVRCPMIQESFLQGHGLVGDMSFFRFSQHHAIFKGREFSSERVTKSGSKNSTSRVCIHVFIQNSDYYAVIKCRSVC